MIVDNIPNTKEADMVTVPEIPVGKVDTYKGHYHGIYVYLHLKNKNGVNKNDY